MSPDTILGKAIIVELNLQWKIINFVTISSVLIMVAGGIAFKDILKIDSKWPPGMRIVDAKETHILFTVNTVMFGDCCNRNLR